MQIQLMQVLAPDVIDDLYPRYAAAWDVLVDEAAARHLLTHGEFAQDMRDIRLEKHVVLDDDGHVVAMTTITSEIDAIPWINPSFYRRRYPAEAAGGTVFYLGYTFVDADHRRSGALSLMIESVNTRLSQVRGVIGFDICGWSMERGIGRRVERMFSQSSSIIRSDTQTYFVADYRQPRSAVSAGLSHSTLADLPDLVLAAQSLLTEQWPPFTMVGGAGHGVDLEKLLLSVADHQLVLLDPHGDLAGVALCLPMSWDGRIESLPPGWDDAIVSGQRLLAAGGQPNALCVLSITVSPRRTGRGVAEQLVSAVKKRAADSGAHSVITPIRPTRKSQFPLIPMKDYLQWTQQDGTAFDPWLRLHLRLGAEILAIAPESMVVRGTVADWESWLATALPGSGDYVIDGGLTPLRVDRVADLATYAEPNVWVRYPIDR